MIDDDESKKEIYKSKGKVCPLQHIIFQAQVLWPPDMPDDMLEDVIATAEIACKTYSTSVEEEGDKVLSYYNKKLRSAEQIAEFIKKHMDEKWEPHWHIFIGKSFGCHAIHEKNRFVYFSMAPDKVKTYFLIYKAT